ncbi:MAG: hypothetical protein WCV90_08560 [Candidatus Woesearchaeota archaeon]
MTTEPKTAEETPELDFDLILDQEGLEGIVSRYEELDPSLSLEKPLINLDFFLKEITKGYFQAKVKSAKALLDLESLTERSHYFFPIESIKTRFKRKEQFFQRLQDYNALFETAVTIERTQRPLAGEHASPYTTSSAALQLTALDLYSDLLTFASFLDQMEKGGKAHLKEKHPSALELSEEYGTKVAPSLSEFYKQVGDAPYPSFLFKTNASLAGLARGYLEQMQVSYEIEEEELHQYLEHLTRRIRISKSESYISQWMTGKDFEWRGTKNFGVGISGALAGCGIIITDVTALILEGKALIEGNLFPPLAGALGGLGLYLGGYLPVIGITRKMDQQFAEINQSYLVKNQELIESIYERAVLPALGENNTRDK